MTVIKYEAHFHEFSKYATFILDIGYKRVNFLIRGLRLLICMATQSLAVVCRTFVVVLDHARVIEEMHHDDHVGHDKRPMFQEKFNRSHGSS